MSSIKDRLRARRKEIEAQLLNLRADFKDSEQELREKLQLELNTIKKDLNKLVDKGQQDWESAKHKIHDKVREFSKSI